MHEFLKVKVLKDFKTAVIIIEKLTCLQPFIFCSCLTGVLQMPTNTNYISKNEDFTQQPSNKAGLNYSSKFLGRDILSSKIAMIS